MKRPLLPLAALLWLACTDDSVTSEDSPLQGDAGASTAGKGGASNGGKAGSSAAGSPAGKGGAGQSGLGGAGAAGAAAQAGSGNAGQASAGQAGLSGSSGQTGAGQAGSGQAGSGQAGSGQAGSGQAGAGQGGAAAGSAGQGGAAGAPALPPLGDFSIGPYPSAYAILKTSLQSNATALDTSKSLSHAAAQGYLLQALGGLLTAAHGKALPGGEAERDALVALAMGEISELSAGASQVLVPPGYGLDDAWDAFGDGSTNPAKTSYAWQTGMAAQGAAEVLAYLKLAADRHADQAQAAAAATSFLRSLLDVYQGKYTGFSEDGENLGFFWYSTEPDDAKAVHNTSALLSMASQTYSELTGDAAYAVRPATCARLLRRRAWVDAAGALVWNYVDDGWPQEQRNPEDISHAALTQQFAAFSAREGWWSAADMGAVSATLLVNEWSGNPGRLNGRVDGQSMGDNDWDYSAVAPIAMATLAGQTGARPELFDFARSTFLSAYLTPFDRPLEGASVDAARALALARMFQWRPTSFKAASGSRWERVAGPGDDKPPATPGGVRFYIADWAAPADHAAGNLTLPARQAAEVNANVLVDLEDGEPRPVVVSLTWASAEGGDVEQWDGSAYHKVASLPATTDKNGTLRWFRTSFLLRPDRFDYEQAPGLNVLLQLTSIPTVHRVEATPIDPNP